MKSLRHVGKFLALVAIIGLTAGIAQAKEPVPEIDPGSLGSALTLLIGGVMALTGFRRKK